MLVKICGITDLEDALQAVRAGADALGFNFYPRSPRYISPQKARLIIDRLPAGRLLVAVVVVGRGYPLPPIPGGFDVIQVHGAASEAELPESDRRIWVALTPAQLGLFPHREIVIDPSWGSGKKADWDELQRLEDRPYILSGGLDADNVSQALDRLRPVGVDVCSGVESAPGRKDHAKVARFIEAVRAREGISRKAAKTQSS